MPELDVVIPVYNEGENIIKVLESLRSSVKVPFRVLICYDYEEDNTLEALQSYHPASFEILLVKNQGQGVLGAVVAGFKASSAQAVLVFPADDTFNAGIIDKMFEQFQHGCDIVAASRFMKGGRMEGCPWLKAILVRTASFTLFHLAHLPTHDATSGFRLFSRRVLEQFEIETQQSWAFSLELLVKSHRLGWQICEIPALWFERTHGQSRFRLFKWLSIYLRWYFYAFETSWLRRKV